MRRFGAWLRRESVAVLWMGLVLVASGARGQIPAGAAGLEVSVVECGNLTDGVMVRSTDAATEWDCVALGLAAEPGERVSVAVRGRVPAGGLARASVAPLFFESEISDRGDNEADAGDFDLDGDPDLILEDAFRWLEHVTDDPPTFVEHDLDGPEVNALGVLALDVNGDGRPDIVASFGTDSDTLRWYQNVPGDPPGFQPRPVYQEAGWRPWNLGGGDLDGDGDEDVVSWNHQTSGPLERVVWHENDGGGAFTPQVIYEVDTLPLENLTRFEVADLDGDGDLDLFVIVDNTETVWLENDGEAEPAWSPHFISSEWGSSVGSADFDRDGDLDVVVMNSLEDEVWVYENRDGTFSQLERRTVAFLDSGLTAVVGDVNGDGWPDLFVPSAAGPPGLLWLENRGGLLFAPHVAVNVDVMVPEIWALAVDLGTDGQTDLVGPKDISFDADDSTARVRARVTVGSWAVGLTLGRARCRNLTTGLRVSDPAPQGPSVDCLALGLGVSPGDEVLITVRGTVEEPKAVRSRPPSDGSTFR